MANNDTAPVVPPTSEQATKYALMQSLSSLQGSDRLLSLPKPLSLLLGLNKQLTAENASTRLLLQHNSRAPSQTLLHTATVVFFHKFLSQSPPAQASSQLAEWATRSYLPDAYVLKCFDRCFAAISDMLALPNEGGENDNFAMSLQNAPAPTRDYVNKLQKRATHYAAPRGRPSTRTQAEVHLQQFKQQAVINAMPDDTSPQAKALAVFLLRNAGPFKTAKQLFHINNAVQVVVGTFAQEFGFNLNTMYVTILTYYMMHFNVLDNSSEAADEAVKAALFPIHSGEQGRKKNKQGNEPDDLGFDMEAVGLSEAEKEILQQTKASLQTAAAQIRVIGNTWYGLPDPFDVYDALHGPDGSPEAVDELIDTHLRRLSSLPMCPIHVPFRMQQLGVAVEPRVFGLGLPPTPFLRLVFDEFRNLGPNVVKLPEGFNYVPEPEPPLNPATVPHQAQHTNPNFTPDMYNNPVAAGINATEEMQSVLDLLEQTTAEQEQTPDSDSAPIEAITQQSEIEERIIGAVTVHNEEVAESKTLASVPIDPDDEFFKLG